MRRGPSIRRQGARRTCFGHGTAGIDDRVRDVGPEMGGGAGTTLTRGRWIQKRQLRAYGFLALAAVFGPEDFHGAGDGECPDPLEAAFPPPGLDETDGRRAAGWLVRFDADPENAVYEYGRGSDTAFG